MIFVSIDKTCKYFITVPTTCSRPSTNLTVLSFTCMHACMHAISVAGVLARPFESKS